MERFATYSDIPALRHIRKICFGDDDAYLDRYFSTRFTEHNTLVYLVDNALIASLTILDAEVISPERTFSVAYIYAVATLPEFRKKGIAEALSHHADKVLQERGEKASMLVPSSAALFDYYAKLGYSTKLFVERQAYDELRDLAENADRKLTFRVVKEGPDAILFGLMKYY